VSVGESFCAFVAGQAASWLYWNITDISFAIPLYLVLAIFANLPLFPSSNQQSRIGLLKRSLYAFLMGLIYFLYVHLSVWIWFTTF